MARKWRVSMKILYENEGNWYKGNLHMHTTVSDGKLSPEQAIQKYKEAGYDFLALSDHWAESENKHENGMLLLSGCEWDTGDMVNTPIYHILGIGMDKKTGLKMDNIRPPQKIIDTIINAGGIAILAHPAWSLTEPSEVMGLNGLAGAEIYNTVSNVPFNNGRRADSSLYFDLWASKGKYLQCFAGDDSHWYQGEETQSFIMVKAKECTREGILDALKEGNFYASQGPLFDSIKVEDGKVFVTCSGAERIVFYSNTVWCDDRSQMMKDNGAVYEIKSTDKYVRVELIDENGKMAWSAPFSV